eukprot:CAMPEP_0172520822 /NCGR_PEP_ID=MMETSP1066-20121228/292224_1 /TAXON_ID=671091 /ORGANISM="Coscinodiscus wailesii, Strain CCMP2513" /LENGTH=199 /DNA_ID=CAMNT_0013303635 /DNA_START=116 /DNA_END=712 /DNA_ORIENTATION=+
MRPRGARLGAYHRNDTILLENQLKSFARRADALVLWLDCHREREAISDEVREVCLAVGGSSSWIRPEYVYQAQFLTVLREKITRALHSLGRVDDNFVRAVQTLSDLDLRVGAVFTRFQKRFKGFGNGRGGVVGYEPCEFPTSRFVVERWAKIETFVTEDFWFIVMTVVIEEEKFGGGEETKMERPPPCGGKKRMVHLNW